MPLAIEYGMSIDEFWHDDVDLLLVYEKAYYRRTSQTAWLNGLYNLQALTVSISHAISPDSKLEYYKEPISFERESTPKKKLTEENKDQLMRNKLCAFY